MRADRFAAAWRDVAGQARQRLDGFRTDAGRQFWQRGQCADLAGRIATIDARRRELAQAPATPHEQMRAISRQVKDLRAELLDRTLRQIAVDHQCSELDYWDSRGAIMPWSIALGGEEFYNHVISSARIEPDSPPAA